MQILQAAGFAHRRGVIHRDFKPHNVIVDDAGQSQGHRADSAAIGSVARVAVRITATTDVAGLAGFLRAVDGGETPMLVRDLAVTQPDPGAPPSKAEKYLRVDVLVEAVALVRDRTTNNKALP